MWTTGAIGRTADPEIVAESLDAELEVGVQIPVYRIFVLCPTANITQRWGPNAPAQQVSERDADYGVFVGRLFRLPYDAHLLLAFGGRTGTINWVERSPGTAEPLRLPGRFGLAEAFIGLALEEHLTIRINASRFTSQWPPPDFFYYNNSLLARIDGEVGVGLTVGISY